MLVVTKRLFPEGALSCGRLPLSLFRFLTIRVHCYAAGRCPMRTSVTIVSDDLFFMLIISQWRHEETEMKLSFFGSNAHGK